MLMALGAFIRNFFFHAGPAGGGRRKHVLCGKHVQPLHAGRQFRAAGAADGRHRRAAQPGSGAESRPHLAAGRIAPEA